jgi:uridine phosphorylase
MARSLFRKAYARPVNKGQTDHLRPTAEIAPDVILPGDPGRALFLAQGLLDSPLMSNHNRGLWGYSGRTASGRALTIQSSGIGGPSLAVVVEELARHGARRVVRVGTCRAIDPALAPGDVIAVSSAVAVEGASRALGAEGLAKPDRPLHAELVARMGELGREAGVVSSDLVYGADEAAVERTGDALAVDLGTATLFALGRHRGLAVAAGLIVTAAGGKRLGDERLEALSLELGRAAAAALERNDQPSAVSAPDTGARA